MPKITPIRRHLPVELPKANEQSDSGLYSSEIGPPILGSRAATNHGARGLLEKALCPKFRNTIRISPAE